MSTTATETKERPILFSGPMVRAILAGDKTQTRREIKIKAFDNVDWPIVDSWHAGPYGCNYGGKPFGKKHGFVPLNKGCGIATKAFHAHHIECPYGVPGDRLWVRETFCILDHDHRTDLTKPREAMLDFGPKIPPRRNGVAYRAECNLDSERCRKEYGYKWTPSIHMPRWASRLTIELTRIRIERLTEISSKDAKAEGVDSLPDAPAALSHRTAFAGLWDKINGKGSWDADPWVWALTFKTLTRER